MIASIARIETCDNFGNNGNHGNTGNLLGCHAILRRITQMNLAAFVLLF